MKWDSAADQHLLLAILSAHKVTVDHSRVAQIVGCTPRACEERIKKLRKLAKECGYEKQSPKTSPFNRKGNKRAIKCGGKEKYLDNADMILYRKGIVLDDTEVKMEGAMMVKREIISKELRMGSHDFYGYGYGYSHEDTKPLVKQQKIENSSFLFTASPDIRNFESQLMPYTNTAGGLEIPLGVPLEIDCEVLVPDFGRGRTYGFSNTTTQPPKKEFRKLQERKTPYLGIENLAHTSDLAGFIEISPASKKDPLVINDDDYCGDVLGVDRTVSSSRVCDVILLG